MNNIKFFNEDCINTMKNMIEFEQKINCILTSPPYSTGRKSNGEYSTKTYKSRYDIYLDEKTSEEYCDWCIELFNYFDKILIENGVVLWNVSYGNNITDRPDSIGVMWLSIADIIKKTNFTVADKIVWKKKSALPNNRSSNKLTRITEDVFVFCRKNEIKTFNANKELSNIGKNGLPYYKNYFNFIEAKNNDGMCDLNKATYSTDLCKQLLSLYSKKGDIIYDPFMGTGTTAIACEELGMNCFGSELSEAQVQYSIKRLENFRNNNK